MTFWAEPPLVPGEEEARRWAEEELAKGIYHGNGESLFERILRAISEFFSRAEASSDVSTGWVAITIVIALIVALAFAFVFYVSLRRFCMLQPGKPECLDDGTRPA